MTNTPKNRKLRFLGVGKNQQRHLSKSETVSLLGRRCKMETVSVLER